MLVVASYYYTTWVRAYCEVLKPSFSEKVNLVIMNKLTKSNLIMYSEIQI